MTIRIVTDSTSDITADLARHWSITVVPAYVNFTSDDGTIETLKDRVEISADEFTNVWRTARRFRRLRSRRYRTFRKCTNRSRRSRRTW